MFKRVLGFAWSSPVTAIGLLYVLPLWALGWYTYLSTTGDALVWMLSDSSPGWFKKLWSPWVGQTIGNVIVIRFKPDTDRGRVALKHELHHVKQFMKLGVFLPVLYALAYAGLCTCSHAHPYYDNPFEIDARRAAGQVIDVVGALKKAIADGRLQLRPK